MARARKVSKINGTKLSHSPIPENLITLDQIRSQNRPIQKTYIEDLNGFLYVKPMSGHMLDSFIAAEMSEIPSTKVAAEYLSGNLFLDPEGEHPVGSFDQWMALDAGVIGSVTRKVLKSLGNRGPDKEKNV